MSKIYLGIDWGRKRIGLAIGNNEFYLATPFKTVSSINDILDIIKQEEIDEIVLGVPFKMTNIKHKLDKHFQKFYQNLKEKTFLPIHKIDERLSSKASDSLSGDRKTKANRDNVSAMLILQTYLDRLKFLTEK